MLDIGLARWPLSARYPEKKWASARKETSISRISAGGYLWKKVAINGGMMKKNESIDISGIKITKLPPGKAFGADDLSRWSARRAGGRFGTGSAETMGLKVFCVRCDKQSDVIGPKRAKVGGRHRCPHCGINAKIIASKVLR